MKQHRGELLLTDQQLAEWRALLEARIERLQGSGIPYYFIVAPNPHSVYPDMLPFDVAPGTPRPVIQLIDYLEETGSEAKVLYPLDRLWSTAIGPSSHRPIHTGPILAPSSHMRP